MPAPTKVTKPTVLRTKHGWLVRAPGIPDAPFVPDPKVERVLTECLKLWPYFEEPDSIHSRRADMVPSNLELLICLCHDVEEAVRAVLNDEQAGLVFKTYTNQLTRKRIAQESKMFYATVYWKVQTAFFNLVHHLHVHKRWDLLGAEDGIRQVQEPDQPDEHNEGRLHEEC